MTVQIPLSDAARAPEHDSPHDVRVVRRDVAYFCTAIVNVILIGDRNAGDRGWVLVDTGLASSKDAIIRAAAGRFGTSARPLCIVLTHGHFDHAGSVEALSLHWDVPVYAHPLEMPFLTGAKSYPPPDTGADGGIIPKLSALFPRAPVDISEWLKPLPADGAVPGAADFRWIHVPGHTPGQVALWRESDATLIAADAVITTGQESAYEVLVQTPEMHGPPRYFTPDWNAAGASVRKLAALSPELLVTGHGRAMGGPEMLSALQRLAEDFETIAPPEHSRATAGL